jgi:hypothetical protein
MPRPSHHLILSVLSALALGVVILVPGAPAAPRGDAPGRPDGPPQGARRPDTRMLQSGQAAPDIELPRLVVSKDAAGNAVGKVSKERVNLSALAGAKPVCLIFTSYT